MANIGRLNLEADSNSVKYPRRGFLKKNDNRLKSLFAFVQSPIPRGGSRTAVTSNIERFVIIVNYYHKALHLGCCSSPRSASNFKYLAVLNEPLIFL